MKAISIWQPWAVLCLLGEKQFETRSWFTHATGPLLIHAGRKCGRDVLLGIDDFSEILVPYGIRSAADLSFGTLIGRVQLVACHRMRDLPPPSEKERALGDWAPDRYAWEFAKPDLFATPIPYPGRIGMFEVNQAVAA